MAKPNPERLQCISIVICNDIYRDEETKNLILVGTFNQIRSRAFPCQHPQMAMLAGLTNGNGKYELQVSIEHEESGVEIVTLEGPAHFSDPLAVRDLPIKLRNVFFERPGKYWVMIKADGEILQQRPLFLTLIPDPEKEADE